MFQNIDFTRFFSLATYILNDLAESLDVKADEEDKECFPWRVCLGTLGHAPPIGTLDTVGVIG